MPILKKFPKVEEDIPISTLILRKFSRRQKGT